MLAAFARAARVLVASPMRHEWLRAAQQSAAVVRARLWQPDRQRLLRRYRDDESAIEGFSEDYAFLIFGLIELFEADGDVEWLRWALMLQSVQTTLFWDEQDGGWFSTTGQDASVLLRLKEDYDGAEPSAASVTVHNLLALSHLASDGAMRDRAGRALERYGSQIGRVARVMPFMLSNVAAWRAPASQAVIVGGGPSDATAAALEAVVAARFLPFTVQIPVMQGETQRVLAELLPWIGAMEAQGGRATAYVCQDFACQAPTSDPAELERQLSAVTGPRLIVGA
jgi:uncharacterized protein YyaL (SSP411 family)